MRLAVQVSAIVTRVEAADEGDTVVFGRERRATRPRRRPEMTARFGRPFGRPISFAETSARRHWVETGKNQGPQSEVERRSKEKG
jgi:hypothetical protein